MPAPTVRYEFTQGYGANALQGATIPDLSGNGNTGTVNNINSSEWLPSSFAGLLKMNNQSNTGNKTILCPSGITHGNDFSVHIGFQWVQMNGFPCVITGGYGYGTHDWWIGANTLGDYVRFSRNGVGLLSSTTTMVNNAYYMIGAVNNYTANTTIFKIWRAAGLDTVTTTSAAYPMNTAGRVGICKYGGYTDNFTPNINIGHFLWWNNAALSSSELDDISNRYKHKYGLP